MMQIFYRPQDAVIAVQHDRASGQVLVRSVSARAAAMLGYAKDAPVEMPISQWLPAALRQLFLERIAALEGGESDIGEVLRRLRHFSLLCRDGGEKPLGLKVVRGEMLAEGQVFLLVLSDEEQESKDHSVYAMVREHLQGFQVLDPATSLLDASSLQRAISLVCGHMSREGQGVSANLALLRVDGAADIAAKYGQHAVDAVLRALATLCRQKLRDGDILARAGDDVLGVLLLGAGSEDARMVLNRLRWSIAAHPHEIGHNIAIPATASIAFCPLQPATAEEALGYCNARLRQKADPNCLLALPAAERRERREDRRVRHEDWGERDRRKASRRHE